VKGTGGGGIRAGGLVSKGRAGVNEEKDPRAGYGAGSEKKKNENGERGLYASKGKKKKRGYSGDMETITGGIVSEQESWKKMLILVSGPTENGASRIAGCATATSD